MDFGETAASDMGIDLGGADGCVAEEFLDNAEVSAMFEQVSGEAVAEHVRRDVARNAGVADALFDAEPKRDGGKRSATLSEEDVGGRAFGNEFRAADFKVTIHGSNGMATDRNNAFLVSFADHGDEAGGELELFEAKVAEFREAEAGGISEFEDSLIAETRRSFGL